MKSEQTHVVYPASKKIKGTKPLYNLGTWHPKRENKDLAF